MWEVRERKKQQPCSCRHPPPGDWGAPTSVATMFLPLPSPIPVSAVVAPAMFGGEVGGRDSGAWMERLTTGDAGLHGSAIIFVNLYMRALDVALASLVVILGICGLFVGAGSMLMWSR
jgi:hypothetical protein